MCHFGPLCVISVIHVTTIKRWAYFLAHPVYIDVKCIKLFPSITQLSVSVSVSSCFVIFKGIAGNFCLGVQNMQHHIFFITAQAENHLSWVGGTRWVVGLLYHWICENFVGHSGWGVQTLDPLVSCFHGSILEILIRLERGFSPFLVICSGAFCRKSTPLKPRPHQQHVVATTATCRKQSFQLSPRIYHVQFLSHC